ncbi:MAG: hypothetical protein ABEJ95_06145 [Candidatus Nanohalobium sp.]
MDLDNSALAYQVFRYTFLDEESYSVQMELKHGLDEEKAEQIILKASEEGLLDVVQDSDPQEYSVDFDALIDRFYVYWEDEVEELDTPVNIDSFLKGYMKSYFRAEENSSLRQMLVRDLYLGLNKVDASRGLPRGLEGMHEDMRDKYEHPTRYSDYVQKGLDNS